VNYQVALTPSQQRLVDLINIGRPLTNEESDELYRALHADYMRKWRAEKARVEAKRKDLELSLPARDRLLGELRRELRER
jgi:hypothetical protein